MKRYLKRGLALLALAAVGVAAYQVWDFMSFYNQMRDTLEAELFRYHEIGGEEFPRHLQETYKRIGLDLDLKEFKVSEDRQRRTVRAEFSYAREISILFLSFDKRMTVWRSLRDVDL